jgi:hypothetical protein
VPKAEVDETKPESTPKSAASPSRIKSKSKGKPANDPVRTARVDPPKEPSSQTVTPKGEPMTELPKGVIAMTGFNDAKGINSNPKRNSPYPLGIADAQGGSIEKGWQSAWPSSPNTTFVSDIVAEGDGALHLKPTTNSGRQWSKPIAAPFKIETMVRCPAGGGVQCYVWDANYTETGPMWNAMNGKFGALDGDGKGAGKTVTICDCKPDTWYKVTLEIDPAERRWTMSVDGQKSETKFGFRHDPAQLQGINFLVEGRQEIYLDAIRILSSDQDK